MNTAGAVNTAGIVNTAGDVNTVGTVNTAGIVTAVCRVNTLLPDSGSVGVTAIDKRPVEGPVKVRKLGLYADVQADRAHHGGEDQALYVYSQNDADYWAEQLGYEISPGLFGENLRVAGLDASGALIGEQWQIGTNVVVEATMPRVPCATFQRRLDQPQWVKRFTQAARPGTYLRVIQTGQIGSGDAVTVIYQPSHGVSIQAWFQAQTDKEHRQQLLAALRADPDLELAAKYLQ